MKKLNKLLLLGAALAGVMTGNSQAAFQLPIMGPGNMLQTFNALPNRQAEIMNIRNRIQNRFQGHVRIDIYIPVNGAEDWCLGVQYAALRALDQLTKTPVVNQTLTRAVGRGGNYTIQFTNGYSAANPQTLGETNQFGIQVYLRALRDAALQGPRMSGLPSTSADLGMLAEMNVWRHMGNMDYRGLPQPAKEMIAAINTTVREMGHLLSWACSEMEEIDRTGVACNHPNMAERWMGKFMHRFHERLIAAGGGVGNAQSPADRERFTVLSSRNISENFAEFFYEAAVRSRYSGQGTRPREFEETLREMTNCGPGTNGERPLEPDNAIN